MLLVRSVVILLLVVAAVSFGLYAGTGQVRYRQFGLVILKWTLIAAVFFFTVLLVQRLF